MVRKKDRRTKPLSNKLGFLSGVACGLFVAFLVYLWSSALPAPSDFLAFAKDRVQKEKKVTVEDSISLEGGDRTSYPTFYKFLPGNRIPIPLTPGEREKSNESLPHGVFLQVGSFEKFEDADAQKAKLALLGIIAGIESTKGRGSSVWYRVKIGPVSKAEARSLKQRLTKAKFDVLVSVR